MHTSGKRYNKGARGSCHLEIDAGSSEVPVMANLITQSELIQYMGKSTAGFPEGTILTPLAKDFAAENHISILIGERCGEGENSSEAGADSISREKFLKDVVRSVIKNMTGSGCPFSKEECMETVVACLERIGCSVAGQGNE